jgi:aryl-alcohol dehydrogenase-like predicted oxidoreductase
MTVFSSATIGKQGFGAMGLSHTYGRAEDDASIRTLHRALELGVTFFDTANVYGQGHNEELMARAFAGRRDEIVLATKFGNRMQTDPEERGIIGTRGYARRQIEASLRRLGTDHVDLYYIHRIDPEVPIEETVGELAQLKQEGKIGAIGLSEAPADLLRRAHAVHPIAALQSEYSIWERGVEESVLPTARELGVVFVAYSPLVRGFLAGTVPTEADDRRNEHPRYQPDVMAANGVRLALLEDVAARLGATAGQISLAWLIHQQVVPIPGTRHIGHLESNLAANAIALDAATLAELGAAFPLGETAGERFWPQSREHLLSLGLR